MAARDAHKSFVGGRTVRPGGLVGGIAAAVGEIRAAALAGLKDAADLVFDESQRQVPVLAPELQTPGRTSGELKATGTVDVEDGHMRAVFRYGTEYAAYQHERLDLAHPNGGNAKFLERPLIDMREQELEAIAAKIREVTGG